MSKSTPSPQEDHSQSFMAVMNEIEQQSEAYWESLSTEDQLKAFCAVSRRIYRGEIQDRGTYRYVLYDVFGFSEEAYVPAQLAGYLDIHNAIYGYHDTHNTIYGWNPGS